MNGSPLEIGSRLSPTRSFGPAVLVGFGGTTAEAIKDSAIPRLNKY
jgi:hypothetical protein